MCIELLSWSCLHLFPRSLSFFSALLTPYTPFLLYHITTTFPPISHGDSTRPTRGCIVSHWLLLPRSHLYQSHVPSSLLTLPSQPTGFSLGIIHSQPIFVLFFNLAIFKFFSKKERKNTPLTKRSFYPDHTLLPLEIRCAHKSCSYNTRLNDIGKPSKTSVMPTYYLQDCHYFYRTALRGLNISTSVSPLYC